MQITKDYILELQFVNHYSWIYIAQLYIKTPSSLIYFCCFI